MVVTQSGGHRRTFVHKGVLRSVVRKRFAKISPCSWKASDAPLPPSDKGAPPPPRSGTASAGLPPSIPLSALGPPYGGRTLPPGCAGGSVSLLAPQIGSPPLEIHVQPHPGAAIPRRSAPPVLPRRAPASKNGDRGGVQQPPLRGRGDNPALPLPRRRRPAPRQRRAGRQPGRRRRLLLSGVGAARNDGGRRPQAVRGSPREAPGLPPPPPLPRFPPEPPHHFLRRAFSSARLICGRGRRRLLIRRCRSCLLCPSIELLS